MDLTRIDTRWLVAGLAVVAGGAAMGASIGSTPVLKKNDLAYAIPPSEPLVGDYRQAADERLPDHYPLVTPEGTVPVAELALRGRLRGARAGWWNEPEPVALDAGYSDDLSEVEIDRLADWNPQSHPVAGAARVRVHRAGETGASVVSSAEGGPRPEPTRDASVERRAAAAPAVVRIGPPKQLERAEPDAAVPAVPTLVSATR